jgi:hypothetical protein
VRTFDYTHNRKAVLRISVWCNFREINSKGKRTVIANEEKRRKGKTVKEKREASTSSQA